MSLLCPAADGDVYSGDVTDANLATQINVLNNAYANAGVRPELSSVDRSCIHPCDDLQRSCVQAHQG